MEGSPKKDSDEDDDEGKIEITLDLEPGESLLGGNISANFSANASEDIANFIHTQGIDFEKFDVNVVPDGNGGYVMQQTPKVQKPVDDVEFVPNGEGGLTIRKKKSAPTASQAEFFQEKPKFRVTAKSTKSKKSPKKKKSPRKANKAKRAQARDEREEEDSNSDFFNDDDDCDFDDKPKKKRNAGGRGKTALTTEEWSNRFRDVYKLHCSLGNKKYSEMPRPAHLNQQQWDWVKKNARKCKLDEDGKLRKKKIDPKTEIECKFLLIFFHWGLTKI